MTEQLKEGIQQVKDIIRMENYDLTEAGARLLVTIEQLIENLEYVNIFPVVWVFGKASCNQYTVFQDIT